MPPPSFFSKFGFFVRENFLDAGACRAIIGEITRSEHEAAEVYDDHGRTASIDEGYRRTRLVKVSAGLKDEVAARLQEIRTAVAEHFHVSLEGSQPPDFLRYRAGDFFVAHQDSDQHSDSAEIVRSRKISTIIFLNQFLNQASGAEPDSYQGGALVFYGLLPDAPLKKLGFRLEGTPGAMVAFPSDVMHEVEKVTAGERYTVVTWFT